MKPFDIEAAKNDAKVCTRDGRPVRILCYDMKHALPIVAIIEKTDGTEIADAFRKDGCFLKTGEETDSDLFLIDK